MNKNSRKNALCILFCLLAVDLFFYSTMWVKEIRNTIHYRMRTMNVDSLTIVFNAIEVIMRNGSRRISR